jgi:glycosyltransferase involved in cell wall biosynthesis
VRVLQVVHNFAAEHRGGTERYTAELARALASRHEVEVFTTRLGPEFALEREQRDGLSVAVLDQPPARSFRHRNAVQREVRRRFAEHARAFGADVVHVQHLIDVSPSILRVPRRLGVPGVVSLHDFWYVCPRTTLLRKDGTVCHTGPRGGWACVRHCYPSTGREDHADIPPEARRRRPRDLAYVVRHRRLRRALRDVDRFVSGSAFTRDTYARLGLDPERVDVIPWGMPEPGPRATRYAPLPPLRFAFLGHLSPAKGADVAIEAFAGVDPSRAVLTLHGPIGEPQAKRLGALLRAAPHVRWAGPYEPPELDVILGAADAVVMPSRALESYGLVVQEAFQRGVPMLVSRAGSLPEMVRDGVDGLVFGDGAGDLRRAVEALCDDPARLTALAAGIAPVKPMEAHAREIEALYERLRSRAEAGTA